MFERTELDKIRTILQDNVGKRIQLTAKKGRKKTVVNVGVIESIHPSVFTVTLECDIDAGIYSPRRVSYNYTDVLTHSVELSLCPIIETEAIQVG